MENVTQKQIKEKLEDFLTLYNNLKKDIKLAKTLLIDETKTIEEINSEYNEYLKIVNKINILQDTYIFLKEQKLTVDIIKKSSKKKQLEYKTFSNNFNILMEELYNSNKFIKEFFELKKQKLEEIEKNKEFNKTLNWSSREQKREENYNHNRLIEDFKKFIQKEFFPINRKNTEQLSDVNLKINDFIKNNSFHKQSYKVNVNLNFIDSQFQHFLKPWEEEEKNNLLVEIFDDNDIPIFQRDNNKWTEDMQISFIENLIKGCKTNIQLFRIKNKNEGEGEFILDGLQRLTAIKKFFQNKLKIFKGFDDAKKGFSYIEINTIPELKDILRQIEKNSNLTIERFEFDNMIEVIQFYIDMNENITHSEEDILKAKMILLKLYIQKEDNTLTLEDIEYILSNKIKSIEDVNNLDITKPLIQQISSIYKKNKREQNKNKNFS